ncbi:MAG: tetratricopeptide repeat protein [Firmicutes bacterium]|nr:tetratricopeptide repeat protein [Bacillota bacterium]
MPITISLGIVIISLLASGCSAGGRPDGAVPFAAPAPAQGTSPGEPDVVAALEAARRAFHSGLATASTWNRGLEPGGLVYPEKHALSAVPPDSLVTEIGKGLEESRSSWDAFFWLDLLSLVPDRHEGGLRLLLETTDIPGIDDAERLLSMARAANLGRFLDDEDCLRLFNDFGSRPTGIQNDLLAEFESRGLLDPERVAELLEQRGTEPGMVLGRLGRLTADAVDSIERGFPQFPPPTRLELVEMIGRQALWSLDESLRDRVARWFGSILGDPWTDEDPGLRQETLYRLFRLTSSPDALAALVEDVERHGVSRGTPFYCAGDLAFFREVRARHPDSYLARGFSAYERVRGRPYFVLDYWNPAGADPWPFEYGDSQYDVRREIEGWQEYLERFSAHPGADDAAYRLARCYEIRGEWEKALAWFAKAQALPDGDMGAESLGRLLFVLDARVPTEELERFAADPGTPAELLPLVRYTLAVRDMRAEEYGRAAERLEVFLGLYGADGPTAAGRLLGGILDSGYPFFQRVRLQLKWARDLDLLKSGSGDPGTMYRLGAALYGNESTFYNYLWTGRRQGFNWTGHINELWAEVPERRSYMEGLVNYRHALKCFETVANAPDAPEDLKARALYSQGLCHIGVLEWGLDALAAFGEADTSKRIVSVFQRFVEEYPANTMADDALIALYAYTGERSFLQRIVREYPGGDRVGEAEDLLSR